MAASGISHATSNGLRKIAVLRHNLCKNRYICGVCTLSNCYSTESTSSENGTVNVNRLLSRHTRQVNQRRSFKFIVDSGISDAVRKNKIRNRKAVPQKQKTAVLAENENQNPDDFYGIHEFEKNWKNDEISTNYVRQAEETLRKFNLNPKPTKEYEKVYDAAFGTLRFDNDNPIRLNKKQRTELKQLEQKTHDGDIGGKNILFTRPDSKICNDNAKRENPTFENVSELNYFDQQLLTTASQSTYSSHTCLVDNKRYQTEEQGAIKSEASQTVSLKNNKTELNYFDQQLLDSSVKEDSSSESDFNKQNDSSQANLSESTNFIEEQYFGTRTETGNFEEVLLEDTNVVSSVALENIELEEQKMGSYGTDSSVHPALDKTQETFDLENNFIDDQYFKAPESSISMEPSDQRENMQLQSCKIQQEHPLSEILKPDPDFMSQQEALLANEQVQRKTHKDGTGRVDISESETKKKEKKGNNISVSSEEFSRLSDNAEYHAPVTKAEKRKVTQTIADVENPKTAYDMVMKMRLERSGKLKTEEKKKEGIADDARNDNRRYPGPVDSEGFRILKDQVIDLSSSPEGTIVNVLKNSILYNSDGLLAINKPYGLPSHGGPNIHNSVARALPELSVRLEKTVQPYEIVHRLDKEATGVMLIAKNPEVAWKLKGMFKRREITKIYWALTKGIPKPEEGILNIPIAEGLCGTLYRMVLKPEYSADFKDVMKKSAVKSFEAITNFRVLESKGNAALVELQPETGVKHQLRCHLAFGLNTPILGDHKYSHLDKIAPQRLYPDMLKRLGIRQSKVRHVPMHLHAKTVILPEFKDGRNLFISANLPKHFLQNMKRLKISASNIKN